MARGDYVSDSDVRFAVMFALMFALMFAVIALDFDGVHNGGMLNQICFVPTACTSRCMGSHAHHRRR
jgi:hypothetical protein